MILCATGSSGGIDRGSARRPRPSHHNASPAVQQELLRGSRGGRREGFGKNGQRHGGESAKGWDSGVSSTILFEGMAINSYTRPTSAAIRRALAGISSVFPMLPTARCCWPGPQPQGLCFANQASSLEVAAAVNRYPYQSTLAVVILLRCIKGVVAAMLPQLCVWAASLDVLLYRTEDVRYYGDHKHCPPVSSRQPRLYTTIGEHDSSSRLSSIYSVCFRSWLFFQNLFHEAINQERFDVFRRLFFKEGNTDSVRSA